MPHPQAAAAANLLLFHCFHGDGSEVLLELQSEVMIYKMGGGGLEKEKEEQVGGWREKGIL